MSQNSNILYLNFIIKSGISSFLQNKPNNFYNQNNDIPNKLLPQNIENVTNLNELELLINTKFNLGSNFNSNKIKIGEGNLSSKIFIIGEFTEEENGKISIFKDESKELIKKMLNAIDIDYKDVYAANVIPWIFNNKTEIQNKEILEYLPFIQKQIEIIKPKMILLMGPLAAKAILNTNLKINKLRGRWHQYKTIKLNDSIETIVTYHPNHLIMHPDDKKLSWEDLKIIKKKNDYEN